MKIGLVCPYNIFRGGGVQECVLALYDGLERRGHEVAIITPRSTNVPDVYNQNIIFVGRAKAIKASHTYAEVSINIEPDKIDSMLEAHNFDLLHFHEPWLPFISAQVISKSLAIHVGTFHAAMSERLTSKTYEKMIKPYAKSILKYLDDMTAVSATATNYLRTLTDNKVNIIPNGIDLRKYKETNTHTPNPKKITILYIGRLEKRKGVKYLLDAFKLISDDNNAYNLVIAGEGPDKKKTQDYVKKEKIKNVEFLGYVDDEKKLELLSNADVFCSPALYGESFGIVLLEAMASGCVTVAGNNGGYSSVMQGRGQISLVDPKDEKVFAERLKLLATDEAIRKVWRDWAREYVKNFDYEKVIDQYEKIYKKLYGERKNKP
jgi:phosphatidylinositol alpha-mannosyltransferase